MEDGNNTNTAIFVAHLQRKLFLSQPTAANLAKALIEQFLPIKRHLKDFDATICSPSPLIDAAWHELILFTKFYAKLCGKRFIHYNPVSELDTIQEKAARYSKTLDGYEELFGARPYDSDIWPAVYSESEVLHDGSLMDDEEEKKDEEAIPLVNNENRMVRFTDVASVPSVAGRNKRKSTQPSATTTKKAKQPPVPLPNANNTLRDDDDEAQWSGHISIYPGDGTMIPLYVNSTDTIGAIKRKIYHENGMLPSRQQLHFHSSRVLQCDSHTLAHYLVPRGGSIYMKLLGIQIHVQLPPLGDTVSFVVKPTDTINHIKTLLEQRLRIPVKHQRLFFQDERLEDNQRLVFSGIQHESVIHFEIPHRHNASRQKLWDRYLLPRV